MKEIWKDIKGYEGKYQVSNLGKVKSLIGTPKILKGEVHESGYRRFLINGKHRRVHILVAEAFVENPNNKSIINHINEDKLDNRACNLEWSTHSENMKHNCLIERSLIEKEFNKGTIIVVHNKHSKQIVGIYNSQAEVCRDLGIPKKTLYLCLKEDYIKTWKNYFFNRI